MEDLKSVIGQISKLRYEMLTDKPMVPISNGPDVDQWNTVFQVYEKELEGAEPSWFSVSWLFAECYMYRKIADVIKSRLNSTHRLSCYHFVIKKISSCSSHLKDIDPFDSQKEKSYQAALSHITSLVRFINDLIHRPQRDMRMEFEHLLLVS